MNNAGHYVRCLKCKEIIRCSRYDTLALLEHIRSEHPEINFANSNIYVSTESPGCNKENVKVQITVPSDKKECETVPAKMETTDIHIKQESCEAPVSPRSSQTCRLYRTSIEKWRPSNGTIYCPKCRANKRPQIKSRLERYTNNSCCAACVLSCWPLCFLPFLYLGDDQEYLYCANCANFLGLYNRDTNCVRPNKDYVQ